MFLDSGVVDGLFADKGNAWPAHGHCNGPKNGSCWKLIGRNDTLCQNSCVIIGEAEAVRLSAKAFLKEAHGSVWETVTGKEPLTTEKRVMLRLAATFGIQKAKEVVDTAYDLCGSNAILDTNPILRRFQDIHVVSQHIQGRSTHFETAGQFFMGMDPEGNF